MMQDELIRLEDAKSAVLAWGMLTSKKTFTQEDVIYALSTVEAVDAESVRHGCWIEIRDKFNYCIGMKCSKCGRRVRNCGENYCPKCGTKMDGGKQDGD